MRRWWRLAVMVAAALGGGVALGWFVIGPALVLLMGGQVQVVVPVPAPMVTVTAGTRPSRAGVPHRLASVAPVSAVPAPRTPRRVVTYAPTMTSAPTMVKPTRSVTPTATMTPPVTPAPSTMTPSTMPSPSDSPPSTTAGPGASTSG